MRIAGHPAHLMLSHFPVALLLAGAGFDLAALVKPELADVARWTMLAGLVMSLPTAATGIAEWSRIESTAARVRALVERHMLLVLSSVVLFVLSMWLRAKGRQTLVVACDAAAGILLGAGAWHGGELLLAHGIGLSSPLGADRDAGKGQRFEDEDAHAANKR